MATRATIDGYFQTGDIPTESQFQALFDSIVWKIDGSGIKSNFEDAATIVIPAEANLKKIVFWTDTNQWLKVGDAVDSDDYTDTNLIADVPYTLDIDKFSILGQTIHLTGEGLATINYKYYFD